MTVVTWLVLILVIFLWIRVSKFRTDQEDLQYTATRLENQLRSLDDRLGTVSNNVSSFRIEYLRQTGALKFVPELTVAEALKLHPGAGKVMADLHLGGCAMCGVSETETLAEAAAAHGRNLDELLQALNTLIAHGASAAPDSPANPDAGSERA